MSGLAGQRCEACTGETPHLQRADIDSLRHEIASEWSVTNDRKLVRRYRFRDFAGAFAFAGRVAEVAEEQGHHPDLRLGWGYVEIELTTHAVGGLSRNDFIMAAKIDRLPTDAS
jgi:4a-hydroxytetrahydrobiopterin dehydratase